MMKIPTPKQMLAASSSTGVVKAMMKTLFSLFVVVPVLTALLVSVVTVLAVCAAAAAFIIAAFIIAVWLVLCMVAIVLNVWEHIEPRLL